MRQDFYAIFSVSELYLTIGVCLVYIKESFFVSFLRIKYSYIFFIVIDSLSVLYFELALWEQIFFAKSFGFSSWSVVFNRCYEICLVHLCSVLHFRRVFSFKSLSMRIFRVVVEKIYVSYDDSPLRILEFFLLPFQNRSYHFVQSDLYLNPMGMHLIQFYHHEYFFVFFVL